MSSISSVTSTTRAATAPADDTTSRVPQKTLGQDDFLKLLATQFQAQDPMKPMEDTAFIAQMAQFSALENSKTLASDLSQLRAEQQYMIANSYLGHRVTVEDANGDPVTGDVAAVDSSGAEPKLVVGGSSYSLSAVLRVEPAIISAPAPQSSSNAGA